LKRKHIPLREQLAAALSMLLPQEQRDALRAIQARAQAVIGMFELDHNILHAHRGPDRWWNLTPMLKANHREKSKRDTSIAAKVKRLRDKPWSHHKPGEAIKAFRYVTGKRKRPRRRLRGRGFDKSRTRHFDGTVTPRQR
jgi:hypothetical protein